MRVLNSSSLLRQFRTSNAICLSRRIPSRNFHSSRSLLAVKPFLLADIGEGIRECEIIQWFVEPGARVEEWDKLCEVQSDKASVEITNRYAGVIKKLHYDAGEMAKVGKPLIDIDIQDDVKEEDLEGVGDTATKEQPQPAAPEMEAEQGMAVQENKTPDSTSTSGSTSTNGSKPGRVSGKHASLATPAVRHLTKELNVTITDVTGTGKDGRVMKDDVYKFAKQRDSGVTSTSQPGMSGQTIEAPAQTESATAMTNIQHQMFKQMTKSLSIPHFVYADEIDFSGICELRRRINQTLSKAPSKDLSKISYLPFIIKAVSLALDQYPILNSRVEVASDPSQKPRLINRTQHSIGVAIDCPQGLVVPVLKNVSSLSISSIARELSRLQSLAISNKLTSADLSGGTITVSNVGSIGGTYVSPVIVDSQLAILGIGKIRTVPAFGAEGELVRKSICNFSWSADHRVLDGATMARAAEVVRGFVEEPDSMLLHLR